MAAADSMTSGCGVKMFCAVSRGLWSLVGLSLALGPAFARAEGCQVAYFKAQAMAIHNTQERIQMTHDWLKDNLAECSASQLKNILGNSPIWLGTAQRHPRHGAAPQCR